MPMTEFLMLQPRTRSDADFTVDGVQHNGRLDIGCRVIHAALFGSYQLRRDMTVHLLLDGPPDPPVHLTLHGDKIEGLHPDERAIAGYLKKNMKSFEKRKVPANKGVSIDKRGIEEIIEDRGLQPVMLHEEGTDIGTYEPPTDPLFIVGDNKGIPDDRMDQLRSMDADTVTVGPGQYQAQQVVSYLTIWLDRR
ncbi:MAG: hypothetical protein MUP66_02410 [Candidatus Nanohaloarchaeota archaeon QJJ-5]|nr:hypothetical protein [Candidatus Nanohaloarchaeota archaeon QJJ-5]